MQVILFISLRGSFHRSYILQMCTHAAYSPLDCTDLDQESSLNHFTISKTALCDLWGDVSFSNRKASSWFLQEFMRSCVAATWMRRCRLHSCTEPMVTTRPHSARCSPAACSIVSQTIKQYRSYNSSLCFPHVLFTQKNWNLWYLEAFLSLMIISAGLHKWEYCCRIIQTIKTLFSQEKEINTKREVKNNCLVMDTCIPH